MWGAAGRTHLLQNKYHPFPPLAVILRPPRPPVRSLPDTEPVVISGKVLWALPPQEFHSFLQREEKVKGLTMST